MTISRIAAHHHQQTMPLPAAHVQIYPVRPQKHELLTMPVPIALPRVLVLPAALEPRNARRGQTPSPTRRTAPSAPHRSRSSISPSGTATELPPPHASASSNTAAATPSGYTSPRPNCPASAEHGPGQPSSTPPATAGSRCERPHNVPARHARPHVLREKHPTPLPRPGG